MSKKATYIFPFIEFVVRDGKKVSPYVYVGLNELDGKVVVNQFVKDLCDYHQVGYDKVMGRCRENAYVELRQVIMYVLREYEKKTFKEIAKFFERDHATAVHAVKKYTHLLKLGDKKATEIFSTAKRLYLYQKLYYGKQENN